MDWAKIIGIALWALLPGFIAKKKGRSFWGYFFLSFAITPLVTTIVTLCVKKIDVGGSLPEPPNRVTNPTTPAEIAVADPAMLPLPEEERPSTETRTNDHPESPMDNATIAPTSEAAKQPQSKLDESSDSDNTALIRPVFCRKCGAKLGDDVVFCHRCGTKVME